MRQPVSSYLLALAVGDFEFRALSKNCGVFAETDMIEKSAREFTDLPKMIGAAETLYGNYRWGRYDVLVLPASFPFGGMENPRLTFATPTIIAGDGSLVSLLAHELAHSWSGNLVTNKTWNDFWLNEGFTVYFENRIMEQLYGKDYSDMLEYLGFYELKRTLAELGDTSRDTHLLLNMEGKDPDDGVTDIAYEKGRFFLRTIEDAVGRTAWDRFLKKYFHDHAFSSMDTYSFLEYLNKELLKNNIELRNKIRIDQWVFGPGIPSNVPPVKAILFDVVDEQINRLKSGATPASLSTQNWNTHQWLHFLRNLPAKMSVAQMAELDAAFEFTTSENCEILCDWFQLSIENRYKAANPAIEVFLSTVGRRKFVLPLYKKMLDQPDGIAWAKSVFEKSKLFYHPLTRESVERILNKNSV